MNLKQIYFLVIVLVFCGCSPTSQVKRAWKAMEKDQPEKADELLHKALDKDSTLVRGHYATSRLFVHPLYENYNIDSAYFHINTALAYYDSLELADDQKSLKRLQKRDVNDSTLQRQKEQIEVLAFEHVLGTNAIQAYQYFLDNYPTAEQVDEARRIRDELAYERARRINTYDAYKYFMDTYPDAVQLKEASELYEFLLYEKKTQSRTLESYRSFLREHPNTNYTFDALQNIFELYTVNSKPEDYRKYIADYPGNHFSEKAIGYLYHILKEKQGIGFFEKEYERMIDDSLRRVIAVDKRTIFPVYENGIYGFKDDRGSMVIAPQFTTIAEDYLCGEIPENYLQGSVGDEEFIVNHLGTQIFRDKYSEVFPMGQGLLLVQQQGRFGVLHLSGNEVADVEHDTLALLNKQYLKYKLNNHWGLLSLSGREITMPLYDDIFSLGDFILFEKDTRLSLANEEVIFSLANGEIKDLPFQFDDLLLLENGSILGIDGDQQVVMNERLEVLIPKDKQEIYSLNQEGWIIKTKDKYKVMTEEMVSFGYTTYDEAIYNENWLSLKKEGKWALVNVKENTFPDFKYDSVSLPGKNVAIGVADGLASVIFEHFQEVPMTKSQTFQLLIGSNDSNNKALEYIIVKNSNNNYKSVYNRKGEQIISGQFDEIALLGTHLFVLDKRGKKGLADSTGNILLPITYDGIGNYSSGYVSTLKNRKFGLFNAEKNINIQPDFDVSLKPFHDSLFIASKDKKYGLIDPTAKVVLPFNFDEITFWNDTLALGKANDHWHIYNTNTQKPVMEDIGTLKFISNLPENKEAIILKNKGYGVITSENLELLAPVYDDIINIGTQKSPLYFAERRVKEAELYVVIYYNEAGEVIHKQTFNEEDYDYIYCY